MLQVLPDTTGAFLLHHMFNDTPEIDGLDEIIVSDDYEPINPSLRLFMNDGNDLIFEGTISS